MPDRGLSASRPLRLATPAQVAAIAVAWAAALAAFGWFAPGFAVDSAVWVAGGLMLALITMTAVPLRLMAVVALVVAQFAGGLVTAPRMLPHLILTGVAGMQAWLAVRLLERFGARRPRFDRLADVGWLFVAGCAIAGGVGGIAAAVVERFALGDPFLHGWRDWWLPQATGMLVVTPLIVRMAHEPEWHAVRIRRTAEAILLGASLLAASTYIFQAVSPKVPLSVGLLPFLVWAALRFGVAGISAASLLTWMVASYAAFLHAGPFIALGATLPERLAWTHLYVAVTGGLVLAVSAAIAERQAVSARLELSVEELRRAYLRVQAIIASAPDMIGAVDNAFRISAFNPAWSAAFEHLCGRPPSIGLDMRALLGELGTPWALAALDGWTHALAGERLSARRGPEVLGQPREMLVEFSPIRDDDGRMLGAVQILRDVTDERRRQEAEAQARRLESVGQLAGGIAHDFNNIITGILAYASLLEQSLDAGDERVADVREIERAAGRAAELTGQLLAYARRQLVEPRVLDPNAQVEEAERLLRRLVGEALTFRVDLAPGIWPVRIDPASLEQVLVNLAINARDAMPGGGTLRMTTANVSLVADDLPQPASGPGDYVRIDVSDTGHGIASDHIGHVFEPFFTTKDVGKGTGLGLASVFGILQQFGGAIAVESVVGDGTTFHVYLPRVRAA